MRVAILIVAGGAALVLAGCGAGSQRPADPPPHVRLTVSTPADGAVIHGGTVNVKGTVRPATAQVRALDRPALVRGGAFSVVVPIDPGVNIVDIAATARGRLATFAAVRVTRDERVTVPDLTETPADELESTLDALGLALQTESAGGLLDALIPRKPHVCDQDPQAGTRVKRGSTVRVSLARGC